MLSLALTVLSPRVGVIPALSSRAKAFRKLSFILKPFSRYDGKMQCILDSNATHGIPAAAQALSASQSAKSVLGHT